jgi:hypothetical protein
MSNSYFQFTKSVKNPKPDRRMGDIFSMDSWPAGTIYKIVECPTSKFIWLMNIPGRKMYESSIHDHDVRAAPFFDESNRKVADKSLLTLQGDYDVKWNKVLAFLIEGEFIDLDTVERTVKAISDIELSEYSPDSLALKLIFDKHGVVTYEDEPY